MSGVPVSTKVRTSPEKDPSESFGTARFKQRTELLIRLSTVAGFAQQLEIIRRCMTAFRPGRDVIRFHLLQPAFLAAFGAFAVLFPVLRTFLRKREGADVKVLFVFFIFAG